jgi:DNA topoisomerase-1
MFAETFQPGPTDAERASLIHVSDETPGITRRRRGSGFAYERPDGGTVTDPKTRDRIRSLAVPPAWNEVWICPDPDGHIQATGRDERGRKQYRYHPRWSACRDEVKYSSLAAFAEMLPSLRQQIEVDLRRHDLSLPRVVASIVWLLDNTMIRVGNAAYARDNKSFGLTTLRDRHVDIEGARLRFDFRGKSGKQWQLKLVDRRIARIVKNVQDLPGQQLFQYVDTDGKRHPVTSQDINGYIHAVTGADFSSKHFRTWGGTVRALVLFAQAPIPESGAATKRAANTIIDQVAAQLGNTRTVCRNCYVHPQVITSWSEGHLAEELADARRSRRRWDGLDDEEILTLKWLLTHEAVS